MKNYPMASSATEPHSFFSIQIEMLTELRATKQSFGEIMSINTLLVSASTAFLERVMSGLLLRICDRAVYPAIQEPIYWKIIEDKRNAIASGTFSFYVREIKELTGRSFDKFATQPSWDAVSKLFNLRNHLLHGQEINVGTYFNESKREIYFEVHKLENLHKYLKQEKLLAKNHKTLEPNDIVNNKVISHFLRHSYSFAKLAHENIVTEFDIAPLFLMDRTLFELDRVLSKMKD